MSPHFQGSGFFILFFSSFIHHFIVYDEVVSLYLSLSLFSYFISPCSCLDVRLRKFEGEEKEKERKSERGKEGRKRWGEENK